MKILPNIGIKKAIGLTIAAGALLAGGQALRAQELKKDTVADIFEREVIVTPSGTSDKKVLLNAPNPEITIKGDTVKAAIVVDISQNILYHYNEDGEADGAYLVASGKKKYPTDTGVRVVTHVEKYPYKSAPETTKRHKKPNDYGPRTICLETIDPVTGKRGKTGEFIHGNNNPNSLGKYASLGCIRMDNEVIKELASKVKRGDIVIIQK